MVKFSKELEAHLIPEWKDAYMDYRQLKKHVKKIKQNLSRTPLSDGGDHISRGNGGDLSRSAIVGSVRRLVLSVSGLSRRSDRHQSPMRLQSDEEDQFEVELIKSGSEEVREFFDRLGRELDKVNDFYIAKESEFIERSDLLRKQLQILSDFKRILTEDRRCHRLAVGHGVVDFVRSTPSHQPRNNEAGETQSEGTTTDELLAALERNGITLVPTGQGGKGKKDGKLKAANIRIDIPATNASRTISAVTHMIWEDLVNTPSKKGSGGDYINRKKIRRAENIIRGAFVELYRGLGLLKAYSSLNLVAFSKILKKFDKVSKQHASASYMKVVKRSHFVTSDKILRAADEVESVFTEHFSDGDHKRAMKLLRPRQPLESHIVTFFVGLFTGSFVTLFCVYAVLAHLTGIFYDSKSSLDPDYVETVYPILSVFALISLHIFLHGCNLLAWRSTRINHNFIFEFSPKTALKHTDAFLICTGIMTTVIGGLVAHLILLKFSVAMPRHPLLTVPCILLMLFSAILLCPLNIFYRSTRLCLLTILRHIALAPFYKVVMADFFMADQLTSQIPLLRHLEFTICYYTASSLRSNPHEICTINSRFRIVSYVVSFLPYYWRTLQCIRRYLEEGYYPEQLGNAGKYISAIIAAAARIKYAMTPTPFWLAAVIVASAVATLYQLYWDFVKDWGFFSSGSKNAFLRNDLVLRHKSIYYVSIVVNLVLRLAWVVTVMRLNLGRLHNRLVDFLLASLEVIRRGHWNYYRMENEHLNNVGKFRAVKIVPLPFHGID